MHNSNIYKTPDSDLNNTNLTIDELKTILVIAKRQKAVIFSFLVYLLLVVIYSQLSVEYKYIIQMLVIPLFIAITVFTVLLCWVTYSRVIALILIFFSLIPFLNILVLLAASSRANKYIKNAGFNSGLLGAKTKDIHKKIEQVLIKL